MALTKYNFNSFDVTSAASKALGFNSSANGFATISPGSMTLIKTLTASGDNELDFNHGSSDVVLDSTYPVYLFKFINVHPSNNGTGFAINLRTGSSGSYSAATKTTTNFRSEHQEDGSSTALGYAASRDLAQSTGDINIMGDTLGNGNDECASGKMYLFNPSSTTFVKHFLIQASMYHESNANQNCFVGGYANTTSAITSVRFKMVAGTIDVGTIKLYGIKDS